MKLIRKSGFREPSKNSEVEKISDSIKSCLSHFLSYPKPNLGLEFSLQNMTYFEESLTKCVIKPHFLAGSKLVSIKPFFDSLNLQKLFSERRVSVRRHTN